MNKSLGKVVGVRLSSEDYKALRKVARLRGLRIIQLVRMILLEWLGQEGRPSVTRLPDQEVRK